MNVEEYIASGILEAYLLGKTTPEEAATVEQMAAQHPEVQAELDSIEEALEYYALQEPVTPSAGTFSAITDKLEALDKSVPATGSVSATTTALTTANPIWKVATAVLGMALLVTAIGWFIHFNTQRETQRELDQLKLQFEELQDRCSEQQIRLTQSNAALAMLTDPSSEAIPLAGTDAYPASNARLYVNADRNTVLLDPRNLPTPAADAQYQAWAIVGGTPVSIGLLDPAAEPGELQPLAFVDNAQLYAVTLEPRGGSQNPTLEAMYVSGI